MKNSNTNNLRLEIWENVVQVAVCMRTYPPPSKFLFKEKKKSGCPQLLSFILNKPYLFCHWQKGRSFKRTILYI